MDFAVLKIFSAIHLSRLTRCRRGGMLQRRHPILHRRHDRKQGIDYLCRRLVQPSGATSPASAWYLAFNGFDGSFVRLGVVPGFDHPIGWPCLRICLSAVSLGIPALRLLAVRLGLHRVTDEAVTVRQCEDWMGVQL